MLKTFTIAAIALSTAAVIAPPRAHAGLALNGPELAGISLNGPSLSGQSGPSAPDEAGMRVVELRRPTAAKGSDAMQVGR